MFPPEITRLMKENTDKVTELNKKLDMLLAATSSQDLSQVPSEKLVAELKNRGDCDDVHR